MAVDWTKANGTGAIGGVAAGAVTQGGSVNFPVTVNTSDVPINLPTGRWRYAKVIVVTADLEVATAVNEVAVLGSVGTPPTPTYGVGDLDVGVGAELKPITKADGSPLIGGTDQLHFRASGAGSIRVVLVK